MDTVVWLALLVGVCASAAALYGHYRVLPGWLTGPQICQLEYGGCAVLFRSPRARLLGVPNAALGLGLYGVIAAGLLLGWPRAWLFLLTWPAVAMSAFLGYSLIANRRQCRICWAGHLANAVLFLALSVTASRGSDLDFSAIVLCSGRHCGLIALALASVGPSVSCHQSRAIAKKSRSDP